MIEESAAIRTLRNQAAKSAEEWAKEIADIHGHGVDLAFAESRAEHILEIIRAIDILRKAKYGRAAK